MKSTNETDNGNGKRRPNWGINFGNVLTMGVIIVSVSLSYGQMNARLCELAKKVDSAVAKEEAHEKDTRVHFMVGSPALAQLTRVENLVVEINTKLDAMK